MHLGSNLRVILALLWSDIFFSVATARTSLKDRGGGKRSWIKSLIGNEVEFLV